MTTDDAIDNARARNVLEHSLTMEEEEEGFVGGRGSENSDNGTN